MNDAGPPLDPRVVSLLREDPRVPPGARERARSRLSAVLPLGAASSASGVAPSGAPGNAAAGALGSHAVTILAFVLGGAAGAGLHAALSSPPLPRPVPVAAPLPAPADTARPPSPATEAPAPESSAVSAAPPRPAEGASARPVAPAAARGSQLAKERALLDDVRAALLHESSDVALERLGASRREFPRAILGEEREALTVEALVAARRPDEARAAASAFHARYPTSLFAPTVDSALRALR